jgi:integrase
MEILTRPLSESELFILVLNANDYYKNAMILSVATGLRISDLLQLKKSTPIPKFCITEQKTKIEHDVFLPSWAVNSWLFFLRTSTDQEYLFDVRDKSSYRKYIKRLAVDSGLLPNGIAWHSLRKTAADVICQNYGLSNAQLFLKHKSQKTTLAYVNFNNNIMENCFLAIQGAIK